LTINQDQVAYYHPGVGTMGAPTATDWWDKQWTRIKGLGFGAGLFDDVGRAYQRRTLGEVPGDINVSESHALQTAKGGPRAPKSAFKNSRGSKMLNPQLRKPARRLASSLQ
jgi:hypothetical protein